MIKNILTAILNYLKDWKNLLAHTIVGLLILAIGLALPVAPIYRIIILVIVILLNVARMKYSEKRAEESAVKVSIEE